MQTDTAFKPFVPPVPMFEEGKDPQTTTAPPKKRTRRAAGKSAKRKPRVAAKVPPAAKKRAPRKKVAKKRVARRAAVETAKPPAVKRERKMRVHKVDLDVALSIGAMLKPKDLKTFGDIRQHLTTVNKATRTRILRAIGQVFT